MDVQNKQILDGINALRDELRALDTKVGALDTGVRELRTAVADVDNRVSRMDRRLGDLEMAAPIPPDPGPPQKYQMRKAEVGIGGISGLSVRY